MVSTIAGDHFPLFVQGDIAKLREVYDAFFAEYPLCFGYWKKYADAENRCTSPEAAVAVYERGVAAIPHSVDLWGHYASFKQTIGASTEDVQRCGAMILLTFASDMFHSECRELFGVL